MKKIGIMLVGAVAALIFVVSTGFDGHTENIGGDYVSHTLRSGGQISVIKIDDSEFVVVVHRWGVAICPKPKKEPNAP